MSLLPSPLELLERLLRGPHIHPGILLRRAQAPVPHEIPKNERVDVPGPLAAENAATASSLPS